MKIFNKKWVKVGLCAVAAAVGVYWVVGYAIWQYGDYQTVVERLRQEKEAARLEEMIKKDAYGGETPQETLQMFINAVEAGDYELASKYFVVEKQEGEKLKLVNIRKQKNLKIYVDILRQAEPWRSSLDDDEFVMKSETDFGGSLFIYFIKYPSNIWKINEI